MPIQWRKQMSAGNLVLDLDHLYLLSLINQVEYALRHPHEHGKFFSDSHPDQVREQRIEITQLLRDWLLDHVLKEDMKMKPELETLPANSLG